MDSENHRLARLLFKKETEDGLLELIQNPEFSKYVLKIGNFSVEELTKEPTRLKNEKQHILEQTQDLAFKNYKTFVQTAECSREIYHQFQDVETKLDSLVTKIPELEKQCENFINVTKEINKSRKLNSITLTRNAQLLEILELAQLMEEFVKCEQYESALELTAYVRRLSVKHPEVIIFKSMVSEVESQWQRMLRQLLEQLRTDIHLPRCLEVVGYLRRMELYTEAELRLKFLQARDTWFKHSLNAINITEPHQKLNKIVEVTRVCLFSITTQYRAIFNDDEHGIVNAANDKRFNENIIFYSWLHNKICIFLKTLKDELSQCSSSIDSILSQCMYFGLSFSRVGCDFRPLLAPIFLETIQSRLKAALTEATRAFQQNMEKFTLINKKAASALWQGGAADGLGPPESLLEFYPLAEYCNQILTAFNELKLCAPYAVLQGLVTGLQDSLTVVSETILLFYGQEQQAFSITAREAFMRLCVCFTSDLVPYIQKCLHILYPPSAVAQQLGVSVQTINRDSLVVLDKVSIAKPIAHLLPARIHPLIDVPPEEQIEETQEESQQDKEKIEKLEEAVSEDLDKIEEKQVENKEGLNEELPEKTSEE